MNESGLRRVFNEYHLIPARFHSSQKGYRNTSFPADLDSGEHVNFILYKAEPGMYERIKRIHAVTEFLSKRGLPVRRPFYPKVLRINARGSVRYGAMYDYLFGATIPWEAYTKNHIKLVGMAMGNMHVQLQEFGPLNYSVTGEYRTITERMGAYFADKNVKDVLERKLALELAPNVFPRFLKLLTYCDSLPDQQVLHMDFVRGNLLFREQKPGDAFALEGVALSGILDFEKTAYGAPIIDVARTLAFLLVDCKYKTPEKIRKYFLHSGYNKRSTAVSIPLDSKLLERLVALFLAYDFYKFLRHNPYESLHLNEHFVRTRDMLLTLGMIRYTKDR